MSGAARCEAASKAASSSRSWVCAIGKGNWWREILLRFPAREAATAIKRSISLNEKNGKLERQRRQWWILVRKVVVGFRY